MKYKVIYLAGLNLDELKALDATFIPANKENKKNYFSRFFENFQDQRVVHIQVATGKLLAGSSREADEMLLMHPQDYVKAVPQFEVKIVAKLNLPFPEEIEENGHRYRLVVE